jgi:hypothetical protein
MESQIAPNTGTVKTDPAAATVPVQATPWAKAGKRTDAPAPPPVWTRYIDSRLKQFCTR